jgi:hypothetical protein
MRALGRYLVPAVFAGLAIGIGACAAPTTRGPVAYDYEPYNAPYFFEPYAYDAWRYDYYRYPHPWDLRVHRYYPVPPGRYRTPPHAPHRWRDRAPRGRVYVAPRARERSR